MTPRASIAAAALALAALAPAAAAHATTSPRLAVGLDERVGARIPLDLPFTDASGAHLRLGDVFDRHRPVVLVLAYARCTMLCSVVLRAIAEQVHAHPDAAGRDYLPVVVSLDPHETPAAAAARHTALLADGGLAPTSRAWPYLLGDAATVRRLADALGFHYAWDPSTSQYAHPAVVFVLTPDGRLAEDLRGIVYDQLGAAVARAARGELTPATAHDLVSCFRFDPALRRYRRRIALLFGAGGATVLVGLIALVVWLLRLDRRARLARARRRPR
ncbi:MAG TPA: SCO family protein [Kofleriaceae bacterium]|nr:SCO family protein [Kofleriaceae bacterium]